MIQRVRTRQFSSSQFTRTRMCRGPSFLSRPTFCSFWLNHYYVKFKLNCHTIISKHKYPFLSTIVFKLMSNPWKKIITFTALSRKSPNDVIMTLLFIGLKQVYNNNEKPDTILIPCFQKTEMSTVKAAKNSRLAT